MLHSGSRHFGKSVCDYFHQKARELNARWYSRVPDEYRLAFLPVDTEEGRQYLDWMNLSMAFARENREKMMLAVKAVLEKWIGKYTDLTLEYEDEINCHHNYAALENHYGENVWVYRKGAMEAFTCEEVMVDLKDQGVILGKKNKRDVAEESRFAYKDIDQVMANQKDLVIPVKRLRTIGVVKG